MLEFVILGLLANFFFYRWILEGDILKLSENWEYPDDCLDDIEEEEFEDSSNEFASPKTIKLQNNQELKNLYADDSLVSKGLTPDKSAKSTKQND
jgi:hypothetical protein